MTDRTLEKADNSSILYLDNAATTFPKPERVYSEANAFYVSYGGNAGRGGNPLARACTRLLAETRELLATWLDAASSQRVIFTASATQALNLAIFGVTFRQGDTIYVTPFEHNSVLRPVEHLRKTQGIQVRQIPFDHRTYTCQLDRLSAAFQAEPPTIVCITQASNVCGIMPSVIDIASLAKRVNPNVVIIVDGAQTAGLYPLPLRSNLIDAFIFSGHKSLYGTYGVAGLVLGTDWKPKPYLFGGTGTFSESVDTPTDVPLSYEAGSHNVWAIAGLKAALEWLQSTGRETIIKHTTRLSKQLQINLADLPGVIIHAPPTDIPCCGILSFTIEIH